MGGSVSLDSDETLKVSLFFVNLKWGFGLFYSVLLLFWWVLLEMLFVRLSDLCFVG